MSKETQKCHICQEEGHISDLQEESTETEAKKVKSKDHSDQRCFNCHRCGHMEAENEVGESSTEVEDETSRRDEAQEMDGDGYVVDVATSRVISGVPVTRTGKVESLIVKDVLDTGCA